MKNHTKMTLMQDFGDDNGVGYPRTPFTWKSCFLFLLIVSCPLIVPYFLSVKSSFYMLLLISLAAFAISFPLSWRIACKSSMNKYESDHVTGWKPYTDKRTGRTVSGEEEIERRKLECKWKASGLSFLFAVVVMVVSAILME